MSRDLLVNGHAMIPPELLVPVPVVLSDVEKSVQRKLAMAGENALLNVEEYCAWANLKYRFVMNNKSRLDGYKKIGRTEHWFHVGTCLRGVRGKA